MVGKEEIGEICPRATIAARIVVIRMSVLDVVVMLTLQTNVHLRTENVMGVEKLDTLRVSVEPEA